MALEFVLLEGWTFAEVSLSGSNPRRVTRKTRFLAHGLEAEIEARKAKLHYVRCLFTIQECRVSSRLCANYLGPSILQTFYCYNTFSSLEFITANHSQ